MMDTREQLLLAQYEELDSENFRLRALNARLKGEVKALSALRESDRNYDKPFKMIEERFRGTSKRSFDAKKVALLILATLALFGIVGTLDYSVFEFQKSTNKTDLAIDNETESN